MSELSLQVVNELRARGDLEEAQEPSLLPGRCSHRSLARACRGKRRWACLCVALGCAATVTAAALAAALAGRGREAPEAPTTRCPNASAPAAPGMYGGTLEVDLVGPRGSRGQYVDLPTEPPEVAPLFRQGLAHLWGFNNVEARRNFGTAAALAPDCALCHWGLAMTLAPNINYKVEDQRALNASAQRAAELAAGQPALLPKTRRLVASVAALGEAAGPDVPDSATSPAREAFANATCAPLADPYGDGSPGPDADLVALCAGATMARSPWHYYAGEPQGGTFPLQEEFKAVRSALEAVLGEGGQPRNGSEQQPLHGLALHLYIHLMEPSNAPPAFRSDAAGATERLVSLPAVAAQGHLTHMPAHLFMRLGRYMEALVTSRRTLANDQLYLSKCLHPYAYGHNLKMLSSSATFAGRSAEALAAAKEAVTERGGLEASPAGGQACVDCAGPGSPEEVLTLVRFGRWQEVLELGIPASASRPDHLAAQHHARALAQYALRNTSAGDAEAAAARQFAETAANRSAHSAAGAVVGHELDAVRAWRVEPVDAAAAIQALEAAVEAVDALPYMEPPRWYYSPRHCLGYALLHAPETAGRAPLLALEAFLRDLDQFPNNGWALLGAEQAWAALGNATEAAKYHARFLTAWRNADTELDTPCPQLAT